MMPSQNLLSRFAVAWIVGIGGPPPARPLPWNETGHQIIARLAWSQLTETTRGKLTELMQQHPRYEADLRVGLEPGGDPASAAVHAFANAANWPDTVRSLTHPMHRVANHPLWHYVNLPFAVDSQPIPDVPVPSDPGPHDVIEALGKSVHDLGDTTLPAAERAMALCWVVHLTSDLHQPLHACTLYSPQFPTGDRGGNSFLVQREVLYADTRTNLHLLWDSLLGNYKSTEFDAYVVAGLAQQPELARDRFAAALTVRDPAAWAQESHELAVQHVYLRGELKGAMAAGKEPGQAPPLPNGYVAAAERLAVRQAALASYRLADLLNGLFDPR